MIVASLLFRTFSIVQVKFSALIPEGHLSPETGSPINNLMHYFVRGGQVSVSHTKLTSGYLLDTVSFLIWWLPLAQTLVLFQNAYYRKFDVKGRLSFGMFERNSCTAHVWINISKITSPKELWFLNKEGRGTLKGRPVLIK